MFPAVQSRPFEPHASGPPVPDWILKRAMKNLAKPEDAQSFGLMDSKYAERFEEVWGEAEPLFRAWAQAVTPKKRLTICRSCSRCWTSSGFPKDKYLYIIVRVPTHPVW